MKNLLLILLLLPAFAKGQDIVTVAGDGARGFNGDNISATSASLSQPNDVAIDRYGNIYIADSNRVRKVNTAGVITTVAGNGTTGFSGDNGPAIDAELYGLVGIIVDRFGNLYITEWGNDRIRKVDSTGIITTIAGNGTYGYNGDNIAATTAEIYAPTGIITDDEGNIIFSDVGNHRVRKINTTGIISTIAGTGAPGFSGDSGAATNAELKDPSFLCINSSGDIYVADWGDYRVRKINTAGIITTVAGTGASGYTGDNGPAIAATLGHPLGVAIDTSGNLFIADQSNNVIRKVNTSGTISTIAGTDTAGYSGDNGPAIDAELNGPNGEAVDSWGNLYINDPYNNRIRKIIFNTAGINKLPIVQAINIYPNPVTTTLTVTATDKITGVIMYNLLGQIVYNNTYYASQVQIDISTLPTGIYFIKINNTEVRKFVKE